MTIQTKFGPCRNVDLDHLMVYGEDSYIFSDYIVDGMSGCYQLFGFEYHEDDDTFHFFVEEGFEDGSAETYDAEISKEDQEYIKNLYKEYKEGLMNGNS